MALCVLTLNACGGGGDSTTNARVTKRLPGDNTIYATHPAQPVAPTTPTKTPSATPTTTTPATGGAPTTNNLPGAGTGSATLSWQPPTTNTDGSALTNLRGYYVYQGNAPSQLRVLVRLDNPGLTRYQIDGLAPGRHYFALTAIGGNSEGVLSAIVSKLIE